MPNAGRKELFNRVDTISDELFNLLAAIHPVQNNLAVIPQINFHMSCRIDSSLLFV